MCDLLSQFDETVFIICNKRIRGKLVKQKYLSKICKTLHYDKWKVVVEIKMISISFFN